MGSLGILAPGLENRFFIVFCRTWEFSDPAAVVLPMFVFVKRLQVANKVFLGVSGGGWSHCHQSRQGALSDRMSRQGRQ